MARAMPAMPSHHQRIRAEREGDVATVTIDSPESKNACTGPMWVALGATFRDLGQSGVRAIVLTGAGGDFCTGTDAFGFDELIGPVETRNVLLESLERALHRRQEPVEPVARIGINP